MSSRQDRGASGLTPQQRLLASRRAIVQHMGCQSRVAHHAGPRGEGPRDTDEGGVEDFDRSNSASRGSGSAGPASESHGAGLWRSLRRTASVWWRSHPAHLATDIAQPLIGAYARTHPLKLLAVAAGLGAAVVVARPWRLLSVSGVLVAALRSTPVLHLVSSIFSTHDAPSRDPSP